MSKETPPLFGRTRLLENQIDEFLDKVSEVAIYFERGLLLLIEEGRSEQSKEKLTQILTLKERCKDIRRTVVTTLYSEMLIPDFRGDVLSLLTDVFGLVDRMGKSYQEFLIEQTSYAEPSESLQGREGFKELLACVSKCIQNTVVAARAFFRDPSAVRDHINEIRIYESEADKIALRLKQKIFDSDLPLERKMLARDAVDIIDSISDQAEDISDELSIAAIKRVL
jgi:hypothetical protein